MNTTYVDPTTLSVVVGGAFFVTEGCASITVENPLPGAGVSEPVSFTIGTSSNDIASWSTVGVGCGASSSPPQMLLLSAPVLGTSYATLIFGVTPNTQGYVLYNFLAPSTLFLSTFCALHVNPASLELLPIATNGVTQTWGY